MQHVIDSLISRPGITLGVGAILSAVALAYLGLQRTRKRRLDKIDRNV